MHAEVTCQTQSCSTNTGQCMFPPHPDEPKNNPPPTTSTQAESLFQAADRIESGNTGREEYIPSRPVMSPVRPVVDNALLDDLNAGTPQKTSNSELDTSFLDDLL